MKMNPIQWLRQHVFHHPSAKVPSDEAGSAKTQPVSKKLILELQRKQAERKAPGRRREITKEPAGEKTSLEATKTKGQHYIYPAKEVNVIQKNGETPLTQAIKENNREQFEAILNNPHVDVTALNRNSLSPLAVAVECDHGPAIRALLARKEIDPNQVDPSGKTALQRALEGGKHDAIKNLIKHVDVDVTKADFNVIGKDGETALTRAVSNKDSDTITELLTISSVKANETNQKGYPPLLLACANEDEKVVSKLLEHRHIDPNLGDRDGKTTPLIFVTITTGKQETPETRLAHNRILEKLLAHERTNVNLCNGKGETPLGFAVAKNLVNVAKILINSGADINTPIRQGHLPLLLAAITLENSEAFELLLQQEKIDINQAEKGGLTPLMAAIKMRNVPFIKALLSHPKLDPSLIDIQGRSALEYASMIEDPVIKELSNELASKMLDQRKEYAEWYRQLKTAGHVFKVGGTTPLKEIGRSVFSRSKILPPEPQMPTATFFSAAEGTAAPKKGRKVTWLSKSRKEIPLEGVTGGPGAFYEKIADGISTLSKAMSQERRADITADTAVTLREAFRFSAKDPTSEDLLTRIKTGKPTFIAAGYSKHSVTYLVWGRYFMICNRGEMGEMPIEVHAFDQDKLDASVIENIKKVRNEGTKDYQKLISALPEKLGFRKNDFCKVFEKNCSLPPQVVGNCTWESAETSVLAAMVLDAAMKKAGQTEKIYKQDVEEIIEKQTKVFDEWLAYQQVSELSKLIELMKTAEDYRPDHSFIRQLFRKAETHALEHPRIATQDKLKQAKNDYSKMITRSRRLLLKISLITSRTLVSHQIKRWASHAKRRLLPHAST